MKLWSLLSSSRSQMNRQVTICNKTQLIQHKASTGNCTLGILMRIQTDVIQMKALNWWRCSLCEMWTTLEEAIYLEDILHNQPYYRACPDILSLVGDPLSGNGCGSPNHIQFFYHLLHSLESHIDLVIFVYLLVLYLIQRKVVLYKVKSKSRFIQ